MFTYMMLCISRDNICTVIICFCISRSNIVLLVYDVSPRYIYINTLHHACTVYLLKFNNSNIEWWVDCRTPISINHLLKVIYHAVDLIFQSGSNNGSSI